MLKVAVLGMGAMGSRMATALLKAGHGVTVWNRDPDKTTPLVEAGAKAVDTPRQAVQGVDFAICMVRDDDASRQVWLSADTGALSGMPEDAVAIESSTVTIAWARELAEQCRTCRIAFLDAPVAGSRPQAEAAQLIYLVGGDASVVAKAEPVFRVMGSVVHHAGPAGSGAAVKLAVNVLLGVQVATMAEVLALMRRNGIDGARVVEIVSSTPVCSPAAKAAASAMLTGNFAPMFPIELVEKDLGYVLDAANVSGTRVPVTQAAQRVFIEAIEQGYGADQMTRVVQLYL